MSNTDYHDWTVSEPRPTTIGPNSVFGLYPDPKTFVNNLTKLPKEAKRLLIDILEIKQSADTEAKSTSPANPDLEALKAQFPGIDREFFPHGERNLIVSPGSSSVTAAGRDGQSLGLLSSALSVTLETQDLTKVLGRIPWKAREESLRVWNGSFDLRRKVREGFKKMQVDVKTPNALRAINDFRTPQGFEAVPSADPTSMPNVFRRGDLVLEDPRGQTLEELLTRFKLRLLGQTK